MTNDELDHILNHGTNDEVADALLRLPVAPEERAAFNKAVESFMKWLDQQPD